MPATHQALCQTLMSFHPWLTVSAFQERFYRRRNETSHFLSESHFHETKTIIAVSQLLRESFSQTMRFSLSTHSQVLEDVIMNHLAPCSCGGCTGMSRVYTLFPPSLPLTSLPNMSNSPPIPLVSRKKSHGTLRKKCKREGTK